MKLSYLKRHFKNHKINRLLLVLLVLDTIFILTHALIIYLIYIRVKFNWSASMEFLVNRDGGYPEIFQYLKYILVLCVILYFFLVKKEHNYLSWFLLFVILLLDDSLKFHERFGTWAVKQFNYQSSWGLRAQDLGELTYVALFGSLLLISMVFGYLKGNEDFKKKNIDLAILFAIFLFFGVAIDMLHVLIGGNRYVTLFMVLLEDGGEMYALSLIVWYFFFLALKPINHLQYLYQIFYTNKNRFIDKFLISILLNRNKK